MCSIDLMKLQEVRPQSDYWPPVTFSPNLSLGTVPHNNNSLWDRNAYNHQGSGFPVTQRFR